MDHTNEEYREMLKRFLKRWSLKNIENMKLSEYTNINNHDNFCYWVEHETRALGSIRGLAGGGSFKFGIYEMKKKGNFKWPSRVHDNKFAWNNKYGDSPQAAFNKIKEFIKQIIVFSVAGELDKIDEIKLNNFFKWKIAYLYSNEKLAPFYEWALLNFAANYLGKNFPIGSKISSVQNYIITNKPNDLTIYEFSHLIYDLYYKRVRTHLNYYLFGSKFGGKKDVYPEMVRNNIICTGFPPDENLSNIFNKSYEFISTKLDEKLKGNPEKIPSKSALSLFLEMKPGDIVAIKDSGMPKNGKPYLKIKAYAVVVEREGFIYSYNEELGHCINVEFIETDIDREFQKGGYGRTIHLIENKELISLFFKEFNNGSSENVRKKILSKRRKRTGTAEKDSGNQTRSGSRGYVTNQKHNDIQKIYFEYLKRNMEKIML